MDMPSAKGLSSLCCCIVHMLNLMFSLGIGVMWYRKSPNTGSASVHSGAVAAAVCQLRRLHTAEQLVTSVVPRANQMAGGD